MVRSIATLVLLMFALIMPFGLLSASHVYAADDGPQLHGGMRRESTAAVESRAVDVGWNWVHPTDCFLASTGVLYVFTQEGVTWFTANSAAQSVLTPVCQTGNLLAFHVVNTAGGWDSVTGQDSLRTSSDGGDCLKTSVANALAHIRESGRTSSPAPVPPPPTLTFAPVNAAVRQGGIYVKVSGGDGVEDAGALSGPVTLPAALTMIATERTTYRYVGWQVSDRLGRTSDLVAGLAFTNGGAAEVRERGRYLIDVPYHTGDVFTIALTPTWIRYLRNRLEFFSHRVSVPESLRAAVHLLSQGATLGPVCVAR